jgi:hypothetical protein
MSQILNLVQDLEDQIRNTVQDLPLVPADLLGLDRRAGYRLWIDEDAIIVNKNDDRTLQYYGGFEYVDASSRIECGDYVIYTNDDSRVQDCLDFFYENLASNAEAEEAN